MAVAKDMTTTTGRVKGQPAVADAINCIHSHNFYRGPIHPCGCGRGPDGVSCRKI